MDQAFRGCVDPESLLLSASIPGISPKGARDLTDIVEPRRWPVPRRLTRPSSASRLITARASGRTLLRSDTSNTQRHRAALLRRGKREGPIISEVGNNRRSGLVVREARGNDLDAIAKLECDSFPMDQVSRRSLRYFLRAPHRPVIAATFEGELAGYALVSLRKGGRTVRIYSLAVDVRFARRGVGRALLQACERYARAHGCARLALEVRYDNAPAIALYKDHGFRQFGEHARYYADGATALRFRKSLARRASIQSKDVISSRNHRQAMRRASRERRLR